MQGSVKERKRGRDGAGGQNCRLGEHHMVLGRLDCHKVETECCNKEIRVLIHNCA